MRLSATLLAPVFAGLALVASLAVPVVLGQAWTPAGPVLALLAAGGFGFALCLVAGAVLMGLGRSHLQFRLAMLSGLVVVYTVTVLAGARGVERLFSAHLASQREAERQSQMVGLLLRDFEEHSVDVL